MARILCALSGLGLALLLSACASMSEKECLYASWHDQGYRDGRQGYPLSRIHDHQDACARVGIEPDTGNYRDGHEKGVLEYCTPQHAVAEGRSGRPYRNACPAALESEFLSYHQSGMRVYRAQQHVDSLNRESQRLQRTMDKEKNEVKRRRLRSELRELDRRLRDARDDLHHAERRLRS